MIKMSPLDRRELLHVGIAAVSQLGISQRLSAQILRSGPLKPLNIASLASATSSTFINLITKKGFFEKYGIEPKWIQIGDGVRILSAVLSGDIDIVRASGFGQTLNAIEKGGALKIIGSGGLRISLALYSSKAEIKTVKDLEGRVIGSAQVGALLNQITTEVLRKHNVDIDKIKFVNIGSSTDVFRAVVAGTVDAGPGEIAVFNEQNKYNVHSIAEFWTELPEYPYQAAFAGGKAIAEKRDTLIRGLAALAEFYKYLQSPDSLDDFVKAYNSVTGRNDDSTAKYQWTWLQQYQRFGLIIPDESVNYLQDLNIRAGIQMSKLPIDRVLDLSMAHEALQMVG